MSFPSFSLTTICIVISAFAGAAVNVRGQQQQQQQTNRSAQTVQSDASPSQRLEVLRSRLDTLRRSLSSATAAVNSKSSDGQKKDDKNSAATSDDPRARLRGLEQEVSSVLSDVSNLRAKQERAERYDAGDVAKLEAAVSDLDTRVQAGLLATVGDRRSSSGDVDSSAASGTAKKKRGFFGRILGGGGDSELEELTGTVAPGRDRALFEEAAKQARKANYELARLLFNTIITTYPESAFLPLAKLSIADTFYLEGTTSALVQAGASYQDWLTFFPTDTLADDVMLKVAEAAMRQMGLADRDVSRARKAENQLKALMQQFPNTSLRPDVEVRLREVQENLAMHHLTVANFYYDRYTRGSAPNPKGAQSRLREIVKNYPNFSYMDEALYKLGVTYVQEEEPDEAAKYFQQLVRDYPNSEYIAKGVEQLDAIGSPKPAPDPKKMSEAPPPRPSFRQTLVREMLGTTPVTVSKNGVLISKDSDGGDLIEVAVRNGGQLPVTTPTAPVVRRPPARTLTPSVAPASTPVAQPPTVPNKAGDITVRPAQPGPPPTGTNPVTGTVPTAVPAATPAGAVAAPPAPQNTSTSTVPANSSTP